MRRPSGQIPKQPITHLWERHREIMRRDVAGQKPIIIAQELGMTTSRLSVIMNSPAYVEERNRLSAQADNLSIDVRKKLTELAPKAIGVLEEVIDSKQTPFNDKLQVRVAETILDRSGYGKETKITHEGEAPTQAAEDLLGRALETLRSKVSKVAVGIELKAEEEGQGGKHSDEAELVGVNE